jgi:nucleoside-diphosphate-sugar epimerase
MTLPSALSSPVTIFKTCILFGGTGFIGSHFASFLLRYNLADHVILADICPLRSAFKVALSDPRVSICRIDVRQPPDTWPLPKSGVDLIVNLAAIHREPGHLPHEYYDTNLPGAEHVCEYSSIVNCPNLIFTSSIAPYGPSESLKTESSIPTPQSAYGCSKLVAEKIHSIWQSSSPGRRLVIVRPGVVFGPGELGNVSRLVQASLRGYFVFMGNRDTRKAAGYVKELVLSLLWMLNKIPLDGGEILYNFGMPEPPSVHDFVESAFLVAGRRRSLLSLPYRLILSISYAIELVLGLFRVSHPFSPVRIRKLVSSNNIQPQLLISMNYPYQYTLASAMADWRHESPSEWR